jgi:hypothetical protein
MRYHIVPVHVPREVEYPLKYLVQHWSNLILLAMLEHTLDDTAAELMHRHLIDTAPEGIHDKLHSLRGDLLDYLLYHVVSMLILNASNDIGLDFFNYFVSQVRGEGFHGFLDNSTAILVA